MSEATPKNQEPVSNEAAYDEHIHPLMARIIALCKEHKIGLAACFEVYGDEDLSPIDVKTVLYGDAFQSSDGMKELGRIVRRHGVPFVMTVAIMEKPDAR